jgi:flagellar protein FlgJ
MAIADIRSMEALRSAAARDPTSAVREAAKQFEALFMQELMKSMRAASVQSGLLDNGGTELGTELLDAQFATKMTGLPGGLADSIARQLERNLPGASGAAATPTAPRMPERGAAAFIERHRHAARAAEASSGIPAHFIIGQAAHESAWGAREIRHADGTPSHNLFGVKAGAGWTGPVAEVLTTEFVDGQPRKVVARFRAYGSYDEAFRDYARLLKTSPRYRDAVAGGGNAGAFAEALQRGGYATDPDYADKLTRVINTTLRLARSAGAG